jgi:hypothetical protein
VLIVDLRSPNEVGQDRGAPDSAQGDRVALAASAIARVAISEPVGRGRERAVVEQGGLASISAVRPPDCARTQRSDLLHFDTAPPWQSLGKAAKRDGLSSTARVSVNQIRTRRARRRWTWSG